MPQVEDLVESFGAVASRGSVLVGKLEDFFSLNEAQAHSLTQYALRTPVPSPRMVVQKALTMVALDREKLLEEIRHLKQLTEKTAKVCSRGAKVLRSEQVGYDDVQDLANDLLTLSKEC